ncbi:YdeI/OmpD-associated family protein [Sphingorhabdus sp. Alg231-15]|uniref:YdeI/OmpD-associated family protein n=1 Tax=Sphingorhabdus sp. Alg231-15 TaxID=1922222 RepID=UPI000D55851D
MANRDGRIDDYIDEAQEFARPILLHLRALVHQARPDIEEAMKWSMPFFTLGGKNLCNMAAFKEHTAFGFWESLGVETPKSGEAMGHFGRIESLEDLPADQELIEMIISVAKRLEAAGVPKAKVARSKSVKVPTVPDDLADAMTSNLAAQKCYDDFAPGQKRDYIEWITEAKREDTRQRRIAQAVEWMAEGKDRHWKYR